MWRHTEGVSEMWQAVTISDKDGGGVKLILKFVWLIYWCPVLTVKAYFAVMQKVEGKGG